MPQHVIQRGNNRSVLFAERSDYEFFREVVRAACERHGCHVHAYVFMTNHMHLLVTPWTQGGLGRAMQLIGVRYVQRFNQLYGRTGTLWEGRYRATVVEKERYLFSCYRYIELNPVRAGLVSRPAHYPWSSHGANAHGVEDPIVTPHEEYRALGTDTHSRLDAYRALFDADLPESTLHEIRRATNTGWALGSKRFRAEVAALLERRTEPARTGRSVRWKDEHGV